MSDLDMDAAAPPLDVSHVPTKFVTMMLQSMSLHDRLICALVCKSWAEAAAAATRRIILFDRVQDLSCLQCWLEKHGHQLEVLQVHEGDGAVLTALPCPQLQRLWLMGSDGEDGSLSIDSSVWHGIAAATKLTSIWLDGVRTASQQADAVSALTALPDLEHLTWSSIECGGQLGLTESMPLQKLTRLTALNISCVQAADGLEHLGLLTRLQHLSIGAAQDWIAAGCPGLQELKALASLHLYGGCDGVPASVSQLTALQQLEVASVTLTALNTLSALTGLTRLRVSEVEDLSPQSPPLQLPGLQHLNMVGCYDTLPVLFLANCTRLRVLNLVTITLSLGPGILATNTMLQQLELEGGTVSDADEGSDSGSDSDAALLGSISYM